MAYSAVSSSCFFREIVETECGPSRCVEGNVLVSECMDDITLHLASCHLSKCSKVNKNELILVRAGIRGLSEEQVSKMTICTRYRHLLGRFWRALRSCQYPGSYWQNKFCDRKTCHKFPHGQRNKYIVRQNNTCRIT